MTVVVGYRPDKYGEAALEAGVVQARRAGSRLVVVNATEGDALVDRQFIGTEQLEQLRERLGGIEVAVEQPVEADVAMAVVRAAQEHQAELVVIGVRHRSAAGKMLLGSHAHRIIMESPCGVLCVKPAS